MKTLSAIITPTFNNEDYTIRCFDSIQKNTNDYIIIWIDNGSSPESREKVKKFLDENNVPYELILNQGNLGFVKATNQGMRKAMELNAKYIVLQNNDTEVYDKWLDRMIKVAEADPKIGLVGPITSPCNSWQSIGHIKKNINGFEDLPKYGNNPKEYSKSIKEKYKNQSVNTRIQLAFFSVLIKSETIKDVGVLSEEFGIGFKDDDDFCVRAKKKGWKLSIVKDVFVFHNHRTTFKSLYSEKQIESMKKNNAGIFRKKYRNYPSSLNSEENLFLDNFLENYFEKNNYIFDSGKKSGEQNCTDLFSNKDRVFLRSSYEKLNLKKIFEESERLGYRCFFVDEKSHTICKISPNEKIWTDNLKKLKSVNLAFAKKEKSNMVAFISHSFKDGGSEKSLINMISGLISRKIFCHVFISNQGSLEEELKKMPVSYSIVPVPWWARSNSSRISEKKAEKEIKKAQEIILNELLAINPDIIYTNSSVVNIGAIVAKKMNVPHIWHIREFVTKKRGVEFYRNFADVARFIYDNSSKILFNSHSLKEYYEKVIAKDKSEVVYNHINIRGITNSQKKKIKYFKDEENLKMIIIGAVMLGKGQKDAVLAIKNLVKNGVKNIELLIVGGIEPAYHKELSDIIEKNELKGSIRFTGHLNDPLGALAESDLFLMCSQDEAFGRVTAEAILMKKPVIGARSGGTPELVQDGFNGFLYEPENIEELVGKIKYFLDNREKLEEFGLKGYKSATDKFNEKQYSGRVFEIIQELKNREKEKMTRISSEGIKKFLTSRKNKQPFGLIWKKMLRMKDLFKKTFNILLEGGPLTFLSYVWKFIKYGRNYFR